MPDVPVKTPAPTVPVVRQPTLWKHPDFLKLWTGQTVSLFGSALTGLALPIIAATLLQAEPAQMGLLSAVGTAPALLIGLFAGVWVDRYKRRVFLIASDVGRALLIATIPLAVYLGALTMTQLYIVGFLMGVFSIFFEVASRSYLPSLVEPTQLVEGNSKLQVSGSIATVAGPSLAGLIIQAITAPLAIACDAVSYLISGGLILWIRRGEEAKVPAETGILRQVKEGFGVLLRNPLLRALAGCLATSNFMSNMFFALYILFGTRVLKLDAAQIGLVYGLGASGAMVGALAATTISARLGVGRAVIAGALLGSMEILPVTIATPEIAVPTLLLSSFLGNFGWTVYNVNQASLMQVTTPTTYLGRMNATFSFLVSGMLPLGALAGGGLGQLLGLRETIILAALGSLLSSAWVLLSPVRRLKRLEDAKARQTMQGEA